MGSKAQCRVIYFKRKWEAGHLWMQVECHILKPLRSYLQLATWTCNVVNTPPASACCFALDASELRLPLLLSTLSARAALYLPSTTFCCQG